MEEFIVPIKDKDGNVLDRETLDLVNGTLMPVTICDSNSETGSVIIEDYLLYTPGPRPLTEEERITNLENSFESLNQGIQAAE